MLKFLGQLILSFVITNWVYSELCLFYPPTQQIGVRLTRVLRLPTHNEWSAIADSSEARRLDKEITRTLGSSAYLSSIGPGHSVRGLWNQGPGKFFSQLFGTKGTVSVLSACESKAAGGFFVCPGLYQSFGGEILYLVPSRIESF